MNKTYEQLKDIAMLHTGEEDANKLALMYQEEEDAVILSYVFCKHFGLTYTECDKYFGITEEDKASFALEELHKAMHHYRENGGASVITLYSRFLNNRLRTETQALNYDKRKGNVNAESFEGTLEEDDKGNKSSTGYSNQLGYEEAGFDEAELLLSLASKEELTENEYRYCKIIIRDVNDTKNIRDSDIAKRLNISSAAVHYIKKSLQKKIANRTSSAVMLNF